MNKRKNSKKLFLINLLCLTMLFSMIVNSSFLTTANASTYSYDTNLCFSSDLNYGLGIKSGNLYVNDISLGSAINWERKYYFSYNGYTYRSQTVKWGPSNISKKEKVQFGSYTSPYTGTINNAFKVRVENVLYTYWYTKYISGRIIDHSQEDVLGNITPRYTNEANPYNVYYEDPLYMIINADTGKVVDFYAPNYNFYYAMGIERASFSAKESVYPPTIGIPTNLKYTATSSYINVSWGTVPNATGYDIEVDGQVIDIGNTSTYFHNNLQGNTQHTYRVRAKNGTSTGNWSNLLTATTLKSNQPPILDIIDDKTVDEGALLQFTLNASDPDGDSLTYTTNTPLPAGATFDPITKTFSWNPNYTQAGTYIVHFEVSDGQLVTSEDIIITVNNVNLSPILDIIGDKTVDEGTLLQFTLNASDPDGDSLTYATSTPLPAGATFDPITKTFSWNPNYTQAGTYTVHFEVSDGQLVTSEDIIITVNDVSPDSLISSTIEYIKSLNLPAGRDNSLISSLENAISSWQNGENTAATNKIDSVINKIEAMRDKTLTNEEADMAIEKLKEINYVINL